MRCTVGEPLPLIVAISQERFFTLGASKMLYVPVLSQGSHHSLFNRASGKLVFKVEKSKEDKNLQAPQMGMFMRSWHRRQKSSFTTFAEIPGRLRT